jgi:hypothetical protein
MLGLKPEGGVMQYIKNVILQILVQEKLKLYITFRDFDSVVYRQDAQKFHT